MPSTQRQNLQRTAQLQFLCTLRTGKFFRSLFSSSEKLILAVEAMAADDKSEATPECEKAPAAPMGDDAAPPPPPIWETGTRPAATAVQIPS